MGALCRTLPRSCVCQKCLKDRLIPSLCFNSLPDFRPYMQFDIVGKGIKAACVILLCIPHVLTCLHLAGFSAFSVRVHDPKGGSSMGAELMQCRDAPSCRPPSLLEVAPSPFSFITMCTWATGNVGRCLASGTSKHRSCCPFLSFLLHRSPSSQHSLSSTPQ